MYLFTNGDIKMISIPIPVKDNFLTFFSFLVLFGFFFSAALDIQAQSAENNSPIPLPSEEKFEPLDGLMEQSFRATQQTEVESEANHFITIYNADGSIWYQYSNRGSDEFYFAKQPHPDFKPYDKNNQRLLPRVKGKSKHWYEVVVNEETQAVKYMLISDRAAGYVSLEYYVMKYSDIRFNPEKNPVREKPEGSAVKALMNEGDRCRPWEFSGDWVSVYCKGKEDNYGGWLRWKKGRDILIGFILNNRVVPEQ